MTTKPPTAAEIETARSWVESFPRDVATSTESMLLRHAAILLAALEEALLQRKYINDDSIRATGRVGATYSGLAGECVRLRTALDEKGKLLERCLQELRRLREWDVEHGVQIAPLDALLREIEEEGPTSPRV